MKNVLIRIKVPEEVAKGFDEFVNENKSVFGTRANLMRTMLANINLLAKVNPNVFDKEKNELKKEIEQLRLKIIEREAEIFSLKNMQGSLNVESLSHLELIPKMVDKLNTIEMMIAPQYFSSHNEKESDDLNTYDSLDSIFKSPKIG